MADEKPDGTSAVGTFGPPPTAKLIEAIRNSGMEPLATSR
jgi:hypothetical protein